MARKTKKQQDAQAQVERRLTSDSPVRLDASSVVAGGEKGGAAKTLHGVYASSGHATGALEEAGLQKGTITTPNGMSVQVSRPKSSGPAPYKPQAPELGNPGAPPVQYGVSQTFEQRIGHEHGHERAAALTAEADAVAARPNPLRSDGHVDMLVALHSPSMGGNHHGLGGGLSGLAKRGNANLTHTEGHDYALHQLGYSGGVQEEMLKTARDRISRRQGRGLSPALSQSEIASRAYGQVNEALDEAVHGTKTVGKGGSEVNSLISDLGAQQEGGARGFTVKAEAPGEGAAPARRGPAPTGPGMTKSRTPIARAQRAAVKTLISQKGGWSALQDADAHTTAAANDLEVLSLRQKARRAGAVAPEDRLTDSPGAQPEQKARKRAQPVFSTGTNPESGATSVLPTGVGVPSETAAATGRRAARIRKGETVKRSTPTARISPPGRATPGEISPVPPSLPSEPARLGRTREERGLGPRDYTPDIAAYEASRPKISAKTGGAVDVKAGLKQAVLKPDSKGKPTGVPTAKTQPAPKPEVSNVAVAQTGVFGTAGMAAARSQNVSLGQRAPQGARSKRPTVR